MKKVIPALLGLLALFTFACGDSNSTEPEVAADSLAAKAAPAALALPEAATFEAFLDLYPDLEFPFRLEQKEMEAFLPTAEAHQLSQQVRTTWLAEAIEAREDESEGIYAAYGKVHLKSEKWMLLTYHSFGGDYVLLSTFSPEGEFIAGKLVFKTPEDRKAPRIAVQFGKSVFGKFTVSELLPTDFNTKGDPLSFTSMTEHWKIYGNGNFGPDKEP